MKKTEEYNSSIDNSANKSLCLSKNQNNFENNDYSHTSKISEIVFEKDKTFTNDIQKTIFNDSENDIELWTLEKLKDEHTFV